MMEKKYQKIAVKAFIVKDNKVLLLQGGVKGWWELAGGKIEYGEDPKEALGRELQEELNVGTISIGEIIAAKSRINDIGEPLHMVFIIYRCMMPDNEFKISDEHVDWKWASVEDVKNLPMWEGYREVIFENME
ncbi:NUDIX domain-containing protein [Candidatus Falkowbacteria bacterium]|nr:MAG: NUDIX domain-containing protein [Candidatus Falkowbacteria bacterium]